MSIFCWIFCIIIIKTERQKNPEVLNINTSKFVQSLTTAIEFLKCKFHIDFLQYENDIAVSFQEIARQRCQWVAQNWDFIHNHAEK